MARIVFSAFRAVFGLFTGFFIIGIPLGYHYRENNLDPPITINIEAIQKGIDLLKNEN